MLKPLDCDLSTSIIFQLTGKRPQDFIDPGDLLILRSTSRRNQRASTQTSSRLPNDFAGHKQARQENRPAGSGTNHEPGEE